MEYDAITLDSNIFIAADGMSGYTAVVASLAMGTGSAEDGILNSDFNWIANCIWGLVDDVLLDLCVRSKYRDLPIY
jgi:hypothetical protein